VWSRESTGEDQPASSGAAAMSLDAAFKLTVENGGVVEATFPFFGDPEGSQLSFQIGDSIKVLQKDELWSWGQLVRTGEEGYFPHNYVQATYKPLPGMHELKQKMAIKRARYMLIATTTSCHCFS
jgi:SH3 domain